MSLSPTITGWYLWKKHHNSGIFFGSFPVPKFISPKNSNLLNTFFSEISGCGPLPLLADVSLAAVANTSRVVTCTLIVEHSVQVTALMMLATSASERSANNESGPQPNSSEETVFNISDSGCESPRKLKTPIYQNKNVTKICVKKLYLFTQIMNKKKYCVRLHGRSVNFYGMYVYLRF